MPTFNRRSSLPRILQPLLSWPEADEIVVVVDGCEDGSIELLRDHSHVRDYTSTQWFGALARTGETITAFIVRVSQGDLPHGTIGYQSLFAAGMVLFVMTMVFNILGWVLRKRFREAY